MPTTTNYGWTTPADTDLVKDGASAIRTLGNSIDSTLKTQIDAQIPDSIVTTKGDLISATGASTPARLAVGTTGQVLTVDSTTATGLKWATAGSSDAYANVVTFTSSGTWTVPSTVSHCTVMVVGGGAGGGSGKSGTGTSNGGQGGSGGLISVSYGVPVTPGGSVTITVGAGGNGGSSKTTSGNGTNGQAGNTSSFGTLVSAQGGQAGQGGTASTVSENIATLVESTTFGSHIYNFSKRSLTTPSSVPSTNTGYSQIVTFIGQSGAAGNAGSNASGGSTNRNGGAAGTSGFGGGGGAGGGGVESTPESWDGGIGINGGGSGGGAVYATTGTPLGGAGGAGATNKGGGGGGGGACLYNGTPLSSGAGGNGGSGFVAIYY